MFKSFSYHVFFFPWETRRAPATDKLSLDRHKITAKYIILLEIFNQLSFFKYKVPLKICHKYWILHACNNAQLTHSTHKYYTHTTYTLRVCSCCNPFDHCSIMIVSINKYAQASLKLLLYEVLQSKKLSLWLKQSFPLLILHPLSL